jgi:hypothetical protein
MNSHVVLQPTSSAPGPEKYTPETLKQIGRQVEAQTSRHSSLKLHKRAIEQQLTSIAAQIHEPVGVLIPRNIFLLLEMRGSGGVSDHLEQIARILQEQGYWKPQGRVCNYHRQDVYELGKSTQRLFDDFAQLDQRVEQVHARLADIKQRRQLAAETTPQGVFDALATVADRISVQCEVDMIVDLLQTAHQPTWFRWLFVHRSRKKI